MNDQPGIPNCSNHKKELFGIGEMRVVAEAIGDLHYETLTDLLKHLFDKLYEDGAKDRVAGRTKLGYELQNASLHLSRAHTAISEAWLISEPFMETKTK
jgi:hypothetical protein